MLQPAKRCSHAFDPERGEEAEEDEDTRTHTSLGSCELNWSRSSLQDELLQSVSFFSLSEMHWIAESESECVFVALCPICIKNVCTRWILTLTFVPADQSHWQSAMECLSLTLEEIVHIRSVLTKAELDGLPVEGRIKEEVEKRKVSPLVPCNFF